MSSELGVERPTTLPLAEPQEERRVHFGDASSGCLIGDERKQTSHPFVKESEIRPKRVRSASFSAASEYRFGNKKRKRCRVLPSKFLLGGNITDPLNLGSLEDREEAQLGIGEVGVGVITKKSDAVRVIIPPNINDPLNLDVCSENEDSLNDALQKQMPIRRRRRSRKRKRRLSEPSGDCEHLRDESLEECQPVTFVAHPDALAAVEILPKISPDTLKPLTVNTELPATIGGPEDQRDAAGPVTPVGTKPSTSGFQRPTFKKQRNKSDKIVSPVIPQPGVERKRHPSHLSRQFSEKPHLSQQNLKLPKKFHPKNELFQYGNYNKYYGYRNPDMSVDMRLASMKPEWFDGKEVLDVGCNIGHITLTIARDFKPKKIVGIDIDKKLVNIAQKNIKHYQKKGDVQEAHFPKSMRLLYGPLKPPVTADGVRCFPHNIKFVHANYVLESDELLETVRPEFDVIICFSITKWIHLNWGDSGLKRFFRRIFYNLRPGGRLVLEPQGWPSYNKRRKLTMRIFENYKNIRLFPEKFNDYLLHEVGFSTSEKMVTPQHTSRGFQRPIIVYTKANITTKFSSLDERHPRNVSTNQVNTQQECNSSGSSMDSATNDSGEIMQVGDSSGSRMDSATNDSGKIAQVGDSSGSRMSSPTNDSGEIAQVGDSSGIQMDSATDNSGKIVQVGDSSGSRMNSATNDSGKIAQIVDSSGSRMDSSSNNSGKISQIFDSSGSRRDRPTNDSGKIAQVGDSSGSGMDSATNDSGKIAPVGDSSLSRMDSGKIAQVGENQGTDRVDSTMTSSSHTQEKINISKGCFPTDKNSVMRSAEEKGETTDSTSNNLCGGKIGKVDKEQGLTVKKESEYSVCDNSNTRKSSAIEGENRLTHSVNHKPNRCISESHLVSLNKNSNNSELCTKVEVFAKDAVSVAKPDGEFAKLRQDVTLAGSSGICIRTPVVSTGSSDGSSAAVRNVHEVEDTVYELSKGMLGKIDSTRCEGLLSVTKPKSPNVKETKDRP